MPIKEREPSKIRLTITTATDGKVTVKTDLRQPAAAAPLCAAERLAVEFLSIAAHSGHAVAPLSETNPSQVPA
jgi:hypothetical protein